MVLAFSLDIFSSHRSVLFIGGQDPVLFVKDDQFSQIPVKERKLFLASPISLVSSPSDYPSPPANGATSICSGQFNLSQGERATNFLSIHSSVRGDLLLLFTAPESFLVISRTLCFSSWRQQLSPFITFAADSF